MTNVTSEKLKLARDIVELGRLLERLIADIKETETETEPLLKLGPGGEFVREVYGKDGRLLSPPQRGARSSSPRLCLQEHTMTDSDLLNGLEKLKGPWLCRYTGFDRKDSFQLHPVRDAVDNLWFAGMTKDGEPINRKPSPTVREAIAAFLEAENR